MIREGFCNHCGECCAPDPSPFTPMFTLAELADPERVEGYCPLLRFNDDGTTRCTGYGVHPFYLGGCHAHPAGPDDLLPTPSCGFSFV